MEAEFCALYSTLSSYKNFIIKKLDEIDMIIQEAASKYTSHCRDPIIKKHNISLVMVGVLQSFVDILYQSETLSKELQLKLDEQERDCSPERDENEQCAPNPFRLPLAENVFVELLEETTTDPMPDQLEPERDKTEQRALNPFLAQLELKTEPLEPDELDAAATEPLEQLLVDEEQLKSESFVDEITDTETLIGYHDEVEPEEVTIYVKVEKMPSVQPQTYQKEPDLECTGLTEAVVENHCRPKPEEMKIDVKVEEKHYNEPLKNQKELGPEPEELKINTKVKEASSIASQTNQKKRGLECTVLTETVVENHHKPKPEEMKIDFKIEKKSYSEPLKLKLEPEELKINTKVKEAPSISPRTSPSGEPLRNQKKHKPEPEELKINTKVKEAPSISPRTNPYSEPLRNQKIHKPQPEELKIDTKVTKSPSISPRPYQNKRDLECTALNKLSNMRVHDRRKEAEKKYEKEPPVSFNWTTVAKSPPPQSQKSKRKDPTYELLEDRLTVSQVCVICHVESPSEFYIRTNQELLENLEDSINEYLNSRYTYVVSNYTSKIEAKSILGNFCFVFLPTKRKWLRVQVLDWMDETTNVILVQLVDYGSKFYCRYQNLKRMTELYSKFPKMAIRCHFAGIYSSDPDDPNNWPEETVNTLIKLSEMEKMTQFYVIYAHQEGNSYAVDLVVKEGSSEDTLGEILVKSKLANQVQISTETEVDIPDIDLMDYDNINEAITGYDAQDEIRICPFTDDSGKCFKGPSCKLDHIKLSRDGVTTDKTLIVSSAFVKMSLPPLKMIVDILITGYINTCHFYAQFMTNKADLNKLNYLMNSNDMIGTYVPFKVYPGIGEIVLVKHINEWCRGRCLSQASDDSVTVFLVDFGITVTKNLTDLRQMKDDFLYLPFQAVECILDSCCEKNDAKPEESANFFKNCMNFQQFKAQVMGTNEPLKLKLWDSEDIEMTYVLKLWGLGQDIDYDVTPEENCLLQLAS